MVTIGLSFVLQGLVAIVWGAAPGGSSYRYLWHLTSWASVHLPINVVAG